MNYLFLYSGRKGLTTKFAEWAKEHNADVNDLTNFVTWLHMKNLLNMDEVAKLNIPGVLKPMNTQLTFSTSKLPQVNMDSQGMKKRIENIVTKDTLLGDLFSMDNATTAGEYLLILGVKNFGKSIIAGKTIGEVVYEYGADINKVISDLNKIVTSITEIPYDVVRLQSTEFVRMKPVLKMKGYYVSGNKEICAIMESVNKDNKTTYVHWLNPEEKERFKQSGYMKQHKPTNYYKLFGCRENSFASAKHSIYEMLKCLEGDEYNRLVDGSRVNSRLNRLLDNYGKELIKTVVLEHISELPYVCQIEEIRDIMGVNGNEENTNGNNK